VDDYLAEKTEHIIKVIQSMQNIIEKRYSDKLNDELPYGGTIKDELKNDIILAYHDLTKILHLAYDSDNWSNNDSKLIFSYGDEGLINLVKKYTLKIQMHKDDPELIMIHAAGAKRRLSEMNIDDMNFGDLVRLEKGLLKLFNEAANITSDNDPHFCAQLTWHREFIPKLTKLVGWDAISIDERLHSTKAYEIAHETILAALPDCRECECWKKQECAGL
jgi:hypothetical protein